MHSNHPRRPWRPIAVVLLACLATGVLTQIGQSVLPDTLSPVANASPQAFGRSWFDRIRAYAAAIPALALGAIGFAALLLLDGVAARIS